MSYRISGNDGVSLECKHWKKILTNMGHNVSFLAGELDVEGTIIPELHFQWPEIKDIHDSVVYGNGNYKNIENRIFELSDKIKGKLRVYFDKGKKIDLLIVANVMSLPMNFPLAVALATIIEEKQLPVIVRHHDFWWERERYMNPNLFSFFEKWFPPHLKTIKTVVINSAAQRELKDRCGLAASIISDSFDYSGNEKSKTDEYSSNFRTDFGIADSDIVFLQATRIVPRKRIEIAMDLIKRLDYKRAILIMAGQSGDEGKDYEYKLREYAKKLGIRHQFIGDRIDSNRKVVTTENEKVPTKQRIYTLWDAYNNADIVTYPTEIEGFGNQFIEAVYFKKPVILTPYPVYMDDIKPLGFQVIEISEKISESSIRQIKTIIDNPEEKEQIVEKNFQIGRENFSYEATALKIQKVISSFK